MFKNILCAVDGSEHSLNAAEYAAELAQKFDGALTILTVAKPVKLTPKIREFIQKENLLGEAKYVLEPMTESVIDEAKHRALERGLKKVATDVKEGHPARSIVEAVKHDQYDCVVLGGRGLGDLEATLLGSVSHKVASLSSCTVVIVK